MFLKKIIGALSSPTSLSPIRALLRVELVRDDEKRSWRVVLIVDKMKEDELGRVMNRQKQRIQVVM